MWDFGRNKHFASPADPYHRSPHLAIRSGKWKLLVNADETGVQLYDLETDKYEVNNIAAENTKIVERLSRKVCGWYAENKNKGKWTKNSLLNREE